MNKILQLFDQQYVAELFNQKILPLYPDFKKIAQDEGEKEIATLFQEISEVEEKHEERYNILADLLESGKMFKSDKEIEWKCLNCGYIHKGILAPEKCPLCQKPQGWYMPLGVVR